MKNYELPISPNYVSNWGIKEAVRELLQNAIDSEECGYPRSVQYEPTSQTLTIVNEGAKLPMSSLVLGCSSKSDMNGMIGKFGEGYKLALVVLLRKGLSVSIINDDEEWRVDFKDSEKFGTKVLNIDVFDLGSSENKLIFEVTGVSKELYGELIDYFPCIENDYGEVVETDNGQILLDSKFKGKMYVEGLYIQSDANFEYGYNFSSDVVDLDRDRKAINYYELRKLTASSVISAKECSPKLFQAISRSYTDIRDIEDVLDDANDDFLQQYRDMLYEEKQLDENTLVATESVMRQLEQMDIDTPVVKGTEIESYLIAKANDKLGLIYQAQEEADRRSNEEDAWDYIRESNWFSLMCWLSEYGDKVSERGRSEFISKIATLRPSAFYDIKQYIPEDFKWSVENFDALEEEIKNQA